MNNRITVFFLILFSIGVVRPGLAQQGMPNINSLSAPFKNQKKPKVMILGTFHFNDGGNVYANNRL